MLHLLARYAITRRAGRPPTEAAYPNGSIP